MKFTNITLSVVSLCGILMAFSQKASAQSNLPDTLIHVQSPAHLVITENKNGMRVNVSGEENGEKFNLSSYTQYTENYSVKSSRNGSKYKKDWLSDCADGIKFKKDGKSTRWGVGMSGVAIGLINSLDQQPEGGLQWSKSFEICWMSCINVQYYLHPRAKFSLGLGFDWRNYKITTSDRRLVANDKKGIEWAPYPEGSIPKNSRLKVFSLQLPFLYSWRIPGSCLVFKCGPVFNFNTYASVKSLYKDSEGNEIEEFSKELSPKRFTIDVYGSFSYNCCLGIYVRYSPMKVMDSLQTLNFQPLSVGITIGI